ncbi:MAG: zinc ribbon domain-containing protein, partial [Firmicutes bacterium]|nr:zinc ribbon domain-containing protein [Bacillota bacterium]
AATVAASAVLFGIFVGIGSLFGSGGMGVGVIIWLAATGVVRFALMHYLGYMVKAGHIAVISEAVMSGSVPEDPWAAGKAMVKERFVTANVYFAVDKLVGGAVRELQRVVQKVGNLFGAVPGMDAVVKLGKFFIDLSLGYIDECCLGWTFAHKEQDVWKSAADGVVIYAQNWKELLKNAAKIMVTVIVALAVCTLALFLVIGLLFRLFHWSGIIAFIFALMIALAIKYAFVDSWILVGTMFVYMKAAQTTVITYDLYGRLCGMSTRFKELFGKAGAAPGPARAEAAAANGPPDGDKPVFCGQCGAKNKPGVKFCGECGAKL